VHHELAERRRPGRGGGLARGDSQEVIRRRYEGCIDGHEEINNKKIEKSRDGRTSRADVNHTAPLIAQPQSSLSK
jgi:hypothetical protein